MAEKKVTKAASKDPHWVSPEVAAANAGHQIVFPMPPEEQQPDKED